MCVPAAAPAAATVEVFEFRCATLLLTGMYWLDELDVESSTCAWWCVDETRQLLLALIAVAAAALLVEDKVALRYDCVPPPFGSPLGMPKGEVMPRVGVRARGSELVLNACGAVVGCVA